MQRKYEKSESKSKRQKVINVLNVKVSQSVGMLQINRRLFIQAICGTKNMLCAYVANIFKV